MIGENNAKKKKKKKNHANFNISSLLINKDSLAG